MNNDYNSYDSSTTRHRQNDLLHRNLALIDVVFMIWKFYRSRLFFIFFTQQYVPAKAFTKKYGFKTNL